MTPMTLPFDLDHKKSCYFRIGTEDVTYKLVSRTSASIDQDRPLISVNASTIVRHVLHYFFSLIFQEFQHIGEINMVQ